jgi:ectoine hydroxylase-related dioxygenase (phytanoyl-CoA dioxygenase family)
MSLAGQVRQILGTVAEGGVCVVPQVISTGEATKLRVILDELRRSENSGREGQHQRVLHLAVKHPAFRELMCHPLTMALCDEYLGADSVCSTWTSNTAFPGGDLTYWHVDHPYWTIAPPFQVQPPLTAHAIWCLDDFSEANGATKFILGSHRRTYVPEHNGNYDHEGVTLQALAGSLIFGHGACWHSAGRNTSDAPRAGIFGRYARSFIIPQEDMRYQLQAIENPSPLVERLLGKNQYVPTRNFPY